MHCLARLGPTQSKILMRSVPDGCAGFNVVIGNDKSKSFWSCRGLALASGNVSGNVARLFETGHPYPLVYPQATTLWLARSFNRHCHVYINANGLQIFAL